MAKYYPTRRPQNGSITVYYIHKQEKVHFFLGKVVKSAKRGSWVIPEDPETGKPLHEKAHAGSKAKGADEINEAIDRKMKVIRKIVRDLEEEGLEPTATLVRDRHDKNLAAKQTATREMESGIMANRMVIFSADTYSEEDIDKKKGLAWDWWRAGKGVKKVWKHATRKAIKESVFAFEQYVQTIKGNRSLLRSDLTLDLIHAYEAHLFKKGSIKNHIGKRLKHVRQFLLTVDDLPFNPNKIKIYQIEKTPIALTEDELTKLENVTLDGELINQCRDMFLLGCYTSLRISDLKKLGPQHFHGNYIRILQEKNESTLNFPMTPQIKRILEKYNYQLPRVHENDVNEQIKKVADKAGLNQPVELTRELKDKTIRYTKKKHEIISTHMAVKTFITLGLSWGISIPDIAAVVGKHVRTIQGHYAAGNKEGAAEKLRELWEQRTHLKVV